MLAFSEYPPHDGEAMVRRIVDLIGRARAADIVAHDKQSLGAGFAEVGPAAEIAFQ
jgi:hypothetical protein